MTTLTIATRQSPLAMWQAEHVRDRLLAAHPGLSVKLNAMTTKGDQILDRSLNLVGGKGLFVKELERAMLAGEADLAVHSMKDVPAEFPDGLGLSVILDREDPRDVLISNNYASLDDLPQGAILGTASLRRSCQMQALRPDLDIRLLRGNVGTRLGKLDAGDYHAIMLAGAGMLRLKLESRVSQWLAPETSLPAVGQGAIGIECRSDDTQTHELLAVLNDADTSCRVSAERAFGAALGGSCELPLAAYALLDGDQLQLRGLVGTADGSRIIRGEITGPRAQATTLGNSLAKQLLAQGAADILQQAAH